jgi:hypothetical protein
LAITHPALTLLPTEKRHVQRLGDGLLINAKAGGTSGLDHDKVISSAMLDD